MLPDRLTWIDDSDRSDHYFLEAGDKCLYLNEYFSGKGYSGAKTNQLIHNFKIKPSVAAANPARRRHKAQAVRTIARRLGRAVAAEAILQITFVPIPPSKMPGHPDHCNRLVRTLNSAYGSLQPDIRELLIQTQNAPADHESEERGSEQALSDIVALDLRALGTAVRSVLVLFDDVLTSGKHFKVCQKRIREILPQQDIVGMFVARCVRGAGALRPDPPGKRESVQVTARPFA